MNLEPITIGCIWTYLYGASFVTQDTTTTALPLYPTTWILGNVLFSGVLHTPGIDPAERPSHSYRNRSDFDAGCSVIFTKAFRRMFCCVVGPTVPLAEGPAGYTDGPVTGTDTFWVFCWLLVAETSLPPAVACPPLTSFVLNMSCAVVGSVVCMTSTANWRTKYRTIVNISKSHPHYHNKIMSKILQSIYFIDKKILKIPPMGNFTRTHTSARIRTRTARRKSN